MTTGNSGAKNLGHRRAKGAASRGGAAVAVGTSSGNPSGPKRIKLWNVKRKAAISAKADEIERSAPSADRAAKHRTGSLKVPQPPINPVTRRARGFSPALSAREKKSRELIAETERIFGDIEKAKRWLSKPKAFLDGKSPVEAFQTQAGLKLVRSMLVRIEHGMIG